MSNFIRKQNRSLSLPPNRRQRKFLHKLRQLTNKINGVVSSLKDKSNALSQMAINQESKQLALVEGDANQVSPCHLP
jgi:hypothetical protein